MQDGLNANWKKKMHRVEMVESYTVMGFQYESESLETGWHITAWTSQGPIRDYWVSSEDFHMMRIHYNLTNRHLIEIFGVIADLNPEERNAVLQAISKWETGEKEESAKI
jgi:hypothetical protein